MKSKTEDMGLPFTPLTFYWLPKPQHGPWLVVTVDFAPQRNSSTLAFKVRWLVVVGFMIDKSS